MYEIILKNKKYQPLILFFISLIFILISAYFSRGYKLYGSLLIISLSLVPLTQVTSKMIEMEEKIEERYRSDKNILIRHKNFIINYLAIFFGSLIGFYISYIFFPSIFYPQMVSINQLRNHILSFSYSGAVIDENSFFSYVLLNNLEVLILFYFFSFVFGAGAIYLLLWNSSIVGAFLGMEAYSVNSNNILYKFIFYPLLLLLEMSPHGILEFTAYFLAALSGGIISDILFLKNVDRKIIEQIVSDSLLLFLFSLLFLVIAAFIEAFII